jgi:hypothetical protein
VGRLAADLTRLAARPQIFLKVLSFARMIAEEQAESDTAARTLKLTSGGHGTPIDEQEAARRLDAAAETVSPDTWAESEVLGPEAMIEHLGVSRGTLHNWRRDGRVIALCKGLRNHVYPVRQFAGKAPLVGIAEVLAVMADPDEAWEWLVTPNAYTEGEPPSNAARSKRFSGRRTVHLTSHDARPQAVRPARGQARIQRIHADSADEVLT